MRRDGGALVVDKPDANEVVAACRQVSNDAAIRSQLSHESRNLHQTLFNPDRLQGVFVSEIEKLVSPEKAR